MSTRAVIALQLPDDNVIATYLHFDGYPDHVMPILEGGYLDPDEALELIEGGELRSISPRPAEPEYFDNQPANREAAVGRRATTAGSLSERRAHLLLRRRSAGRIKEPDAAAHRMFSSRAPTGIGDSPVRSSTAALPVNRW